MSDPVPTLAELRASLSAISGNGKDNPVLTFGLAPLDGRLADGGVRLNALHEIGSRGSNWGDDAAAILFVAGIAARTKGEVLWVVRSRDLFARLLATLG